MRHGRRMRDECFHSSQAFRKRAHFQVIEDGARIFQCNDVEGYHGAESALLAQGHFKEALESFTTAKQLAVPNDAVDFIDANIAVALLANDRFSEAIAQARLAIAESVSSSAAI